MFNLIAIGDPVIDTHVQIDSSCEECQLLDRKEMQICFEYGAKIPIVDSFQDLGGNAPNVAVGASKLGLVTAIISTVGDDAFGHLALEELRKKGVDTQFVTLDLRSKSRYSIVLNYRGERTILSYSEKKHYIWPKKAPFSDWIYYTGLSAGFEPIQRKLLNFLKKNQRIKLAVNPGSYLLKYALPKIKEILPVTELLLVNLEEAQKISGVIISDDKTTLQAIKKLLILGAKEIVLTDGINGAYAGNKDETWHLTSFPIKVTAKTGAGDSFSSAYIAAKFFKHDIPTALLWGTANSSSVIQQHGPHKGLLDERGIRGILKNFSNIKPKRLL